MKRGSKMLLCLASGLVLSTSARGATADLQGTPYGGIPVRNAFALKPVPPPQPPPPPAPPPVPKITLQGITSILGRWQVLFKAQLPPKPGEPPKAETSFVMNEGERDGEIEVLQIDGKAGSVTFKNYGVVQTMTLKDDGAKLSGVGIAPPPPFAGAPQTPVNPFTPQPAVSSAGAPGIPAPNLVRPTRPGGAAPSVGPGVAVGVPTPMPVASVAPSPQPQLSAEEQIVLMEIHREVTKDQVQRGELPPLPPTELTPPGAPGSPKAPIPRLTPQ